MHTYRLNSNQFLLFAIIALFFFLPVQSVLASVYRCANNSLVSQASHCNNRGGLATDGICSNGYIEAGEQCDNGSNNTDTEPNGCRNSCRWAYCGDGVVDSGEQCDGDDKKGAICSDFDENGNINYNNPTPYYWGGSLSCKYDCSLDLSECHYCGDGITQSTHEQCDDANNANDDGCNNNCTACVSLNNNLDITHDTEICSQNYNADDYGDLGAIIIKAPNLVLDCDYARLTGQGDGIGIYIKRSDNVTVKNCIIDNYEYGIYAEDSDGIQIYGLGNKIYNSTEQVVLDNSTALPAPKPTAEKANLGINPNMQTLMGQKLQTKQVPSRIGDSLKTQAISSALPASTGKSSYSRTTPRTLAKPASSSTKRTVKPLLKTQQQNTAYKATPTIIYPQSNQRFAAPARVVVRASYDKKRKVTYLLKRLSGKRSVQRSTSPVFRGLTAGKYCVAASYVGKGETLSTCVNFNVVQSR